MRTRTLPAALLLCVPLALLPALPVAGAPPAMASTSAGTPTDTTPPQIDLDPCFGSEPCQREAAYVAGRLDDGDDLAVLGALLDGEPVAERVYDDGSGFEPHGPFTAPGQDTVEEVDYAMVVGVPEGEHQVTFYARDLEGNESSRTTTVIGADAPGRPQGLRAEARPRRGGFVLRWDGADPNGSHVHTYRIRHGREDRTTRGGVPESPATRLVWSGLEPGWHTFRVRATNGIGEGRASRVRAYLHRP
ncbi:hypothetical protein I601_1559 [Nocardioides dokdonensis FR1436]|uniref:Fibronectin type-III domain-containing protein n=1 Tax=Nocardioides dokdonensis FR1436 TaxID=1300347 RepID=A0A1A9GK03_9ACTN|nr:fibronectin type III domain-containing protein [Nocardioides dokdonensis]ANH37992.1 hypothetical protein I601_1559 [Nocardioides dokdonensis FR1436]